MNERAATSLTRARATLILDQPFFGALALRMPMVEDTSIKTLSVNGKVIKYNPEFVNSLTPRVIKAAVAHEVMHCVLSHIDRLGERQHRRWNQAGDYALNQLLVDVGFELGEGWLINPAFKGMSADHIYTLLPEADESGGNGHGDPMDEMEPGDPDPSLAAESAREWKVATIQAANAAKIMGKLPGELERFIDGILKSKVDWRAVLRRFVAETTKADYSWQRPNRAMLVHGVYMPSLFSQSMGDIVIAIDTSGSIDAPTLEAFNAECEGIIAETLPANVHVIYCDSAVNRVESFARHDNFKLKACGGGGTAFQPVFDKVAELNLRPVCLVYLTDLYGPTNFEAPDYPTLWCCTSDKVGPWGETVALEL